MIVKMKILGKERELNYFHNELASLLDVKDRDEIGIYVELTLKQWNDPEYLERIRYKKEDMVQ